MDSADRLRKIVHDVTPILYARSEEEVDARSAPDGWNARQVIGHLIDSASNNHQRFVRAQFSDELVFPGYDGEQWVAVQRYADAEWSTLVALWASFNQHIAHVVANVPDSLLQQPRRKHNLHELAWKRVPETEPATLGYFIADYVGHLEHHLEQIGIEVD